VSGLGDDFRKRAAAKNEEAAKFLKSQEFQTNRVVQASAVVTKVTANMLSLLAEVVDYLRGEDAIDASAEKRQARTERFHGLRKAFVAATNDGDFTEYDRLIAELSQPVARGGGSGEGSDGESGGGGDVG
jgi:hypothetical protein